jgi:hypothetical protein
MMRSLITVLALLGGCSADPCAGQDGACLAVSVEGSAAVARVDGLRLETQAGPLAASTVLSPTGGGEVDLPVTVAVVFDALNTSTEIGIAVTGLLHGAEVGHGEGSTTLAPGEHRALTITLQAPGTAPDMSKNDFAVDAGADGAVVDAAVDRTDLWQPDLFSGDLAGTVPLEVTVFNLGGGSGTVTSNPPGLTCSAGTCVASFPVGTPVQLAASSAVSTIGGWGGDCPARSGALCTVTMNGPRSTTVSFGPAANYVFVSSTTLATSTFGAGGNAVTVANTRCNTLASAAGLPGTFKAWISTSTSNAKDQLGTSAGWLRPDGLPFANTQSDLLTQRKVFFPPMLDENGAPTPAATVATGTTFNGTYDSVNCLDWSDSDFYGGGKPTSSQTWSAYSGSTCGAAHIYCFGVGRSANVTPAPMSGRTAFASGAFLPGGGVNAADAKCASDASGASLPGTYKALLATTTSSALSRFNLQGPIWVRPDGVPLVLHAGDLVSNVLVAGLDQQADGSIVPPSSGGLYWPVWTGADSLSVESTLMQTCADWTIGNNTSGAIIGLLGDTVASPGWLKKLGGLVSCGFNQAIRLYCLQE